jgi:iron complex outermembrane receptor protein
MSNIPQLNVRSALRRLLYSTLGIQLLALPVAYAQQAAGRPPAPGAEEPVKLEKTVVTGSLIPTAETVGAAPVQTVTAVEIERTGAQDVLELVKKISPVFSGNVNVGQEVNNGGAGESNVAIRNLRTLVLLNGRRLGNSSFSNGQLVDLNTIPLAAVERIEILKDGASALYGSDAVGGVVNIITKRNFSGVEIGGRYGFATGEGTFTEKRATVVGGTRTENASFTAAMQWYQRDPLLSTDRDIAHLNAAELEAKNIGFVNYLSPSFNGKVQDGGTVYLLRSHPLLQEFAPGLYNPNAPLTPPRIPDGLGGFLTFSGPTAVQDYNNNPYWATPAGQAALNGAPSPYVTDPSFPGISLNTPLFGTHSIQSQERRNFFGTGEYDLYEKKMTLFADFLFADIQSQGVLAPAPVVGLGVFQGNIDIPAGNIYNPFGIDLGPNGAAAPRVRTRFVDSGNRLSDSQSDFYHVVAGLKGEFETGYAYNAAYNYNRYNQVQYTRNAINGAALDLALQPNVNPVLAAQGLSRLLGAAGPVPMYNMFSVPAGTIVNGPLSNDPRTIEAIKTTLYSSGVSEEWDASAVVTGAPLDLPGGQLGFAVGGGFGSESLFTDFDGLTRIGKVPGLNAALPTGGRRDNWAAFAEVRIPITSPDLEIPGLRSLEFTVAGRYENFQPGGDSAVPKVGARWQPLDEQVTLRGSYAQSFVAPTTFELFHGNQVNVPGVSVPLSSAEPSRTNDFALQEYTSNVSNSGLKPADAESWTAGVVFSPKFIKGLTVSVDYYHIKTENEIFRLGVQTMVDDINNLGSGSIYASRFFRGDGTQITTPAINQANDADWGNLFVPLANGAQVETDGIDISVNYRLETEKAGVFNLYANANVLLSYDYQDPVAGGPFKYAGLYSDINNVGIGGEQGTLPDFQINTGVSWDIFDFTATVSARYIPEVDVWQGEGFTVDGSPWTVDSWYSIDAQLAYHIGEKYGHWLKGTRIAVGVNNITDNEPPLIASAFEDNTDKSTYDIIGRFVYFELAKKF